ncbi:hypothetical protein PAXRUDRAFT_827716 [Paxillus rubicundulus Ve08.2h10]|uniref:Rhodopsin domain-containing protein n=1 Tax=Paxillus rubicundulus Ve08.2h10 TaxID=930991 RepID=A0A0D0DXD1_9AGAM|nr:hypothetical protein PAXRUDRAFT_827716 [Paxillus rubicundulus Ve08.2h10]
MFPPWGPKMIAMASTFHGFAILLTTFRLWYRWHTSRMWWEDGWAVVALLGDITCLVCVWLEQPLPNSSVPRYFTISNWMLSFAFPTVLWAARISILTSMVRVSHPGPALKRIAYCIGVAFGIMWLSFCAERLEDCLRNACLMERPLAISQTIMDTIGDVLLTGLPIRFLRDVKLDRKRRILITSAFSASLIINLVTVLEAVFMFRPMTSGTIIITHVKTALSLVVCNLLVLVPLVYRIIHRRDLEDSEREGTRVEFTTVDLNYMGYSQELSKGTTLSVPSTATKSGQLLSTGSYPS